MKYFISKEKYTRTASGANWKSKPDSTVKEEITRAQFENYTSRDTIRFFNGFCGGSCRATYGYTFAGYVPVKITLINPDHTEKEVDRFTIVND